MGCVRAAVKTIAVNVLHLYIYTYADDWDTLTGNAVHPWSVGSPDVVSNQLQDVAEHAVHELRRYCRHRVSERKQQQVDVAITLQAL